MIDGLTYGALEDHLRGGRHCLDQLVRETSRYGHLALMVRDSGCEKAPDDLRNRKGLRDERPVENGDSGQIGGSSGRVGFDSSRFRDLIRDAYELADRLVRLAVDSGVQVDDTNPINIPRERKDWK